MTNRKSKIIKYLIASAVVLLVVNVALNFKKKPPKKELVNELSIRQIENVFFRVLDDYGIEKNWISTKKVKPTDEDSIRVQYFVKLPADMPVPLIIKDINKVIEKDITAFVSDEKKIYSTTEVRIYTNEILKLKATLIPDKENIRKCNDFSFIINNAFDLNDSNYKKFLSVYFPVVALVVPGADIETKVDTLKNYQKEYAIHINDDIKDSELKLNPSFQKQILRGSIGNIISDFKDAKLFVVDEKSKIFKSPIFSFVRDEFKRQGIILHPELEFVNLDAKEDSSLILKFCSYANNTTGSNPKIFVMKFENFEKIFGEIERFKKKGSKIIPISRTYLDHK